MELQSGIDGIRVIDATEVQSEFAGDLDFTRFEEAGIPRKSIEISLNDFEAYLENVHYEQNYASYVADFVNAYEKLGKDPESVKRKYFEQFLASRLSGPNSEHVVADIAAANCPFSVILKDVFNVRRSFHQDLNKANVKAFPFLDDDRIEHVQGNAENLPFENESVDFMYLLNSWEHFQAPTDLNFLLEAQRCLKTGGTVFILPLNGSRKAYVMTDPDLWDKKQIYEAGKLPVFRNGVAVHVSKCGQVYGQYHDADLLVEFAKKTPALQYEILTVSLDRQQSWFPERSWDILAATKR